MHVHIHSIYKCVCLCMYTYTHDYFLPLSVGIDEVLSLRWVESAFALIMPRPPLISWSYIIKHTLDI